MQKKTRLLLSVLLLFFGLLCVVAQAQDGIAVETGRPEFIEKMLEKTSEESRAEVAALLKLDDDQLKRLGDGFAKKYNLNAVRLENKVDPSILGGVILQVKDRVIDGSVKNKLKKIRAQIIDEN